MGSDIYVIGSGPSLNFIDPDFFTGKRVIAVNSAADRLGLYDKAIVSTHTHYHDEGLMLADKYPSSYVWMPQGDQGFAGEPKALRPNVTYYPHPPTRYDFNVETAVSDGGLIVGSTGVHGAMHLACLFGASNVILVGCDCGRIDGKANIDGYVSGDLATNDSGYWLARWDRHLREVKAWLVDKWGVNVYSLNPFVNFNLEGHTWS